MKKITLLIFTILLSLKTFSQHYNNNFEKNIDSILVKYYKNKKFNGNILISVKQKIVYHKSFGYSNFQDSTLLDTNSIFYIASIAKIFTATAIMILQQEKKLSLNDKITKYLNDLPEIYKSVKIKHLLTHTAGIPYDKNNEVELIGMTNYDVYEFLKKQKILLYKPGIFYSYSNFGYILLALIIENITKTTYKTYIENNIFKKSNMNNTFVIDEKTILENYKIVSSYENNKMADYPIYINGSAGVYSTTRDIYKWNKTFFYTDFVKKRTKRKMLSQAKLYGGAKANYGLGFMLNYSNNQIIAGHNGKSHGFRNLYEHQIKNDVTIIIFTNIGDQTPLWEIRNKINTEIEKFYL